MKINVHFYQSGSGHWWATVDVGEPRGIFPHGPWFTLEGAREAVGALINLDHPDTAVEVTP